MVLIDQKRGQQRDRFQTVMENVPAPKKRRKVWLEPLVAFRLSPGLAVGVGAPLGFFGKRFSNPLGLCETPYPNGLTEMGSAYAQK